VDVQRAAVNSIEIAYETFGDRSDPPIVLVMGLGTQLIGWPEGLCRLLAAEGFHVVRFDNRDIGQSTHLHSLPVPNVLRLAAHLGSPVYTIEDMARDTVGLLDALELDAVHLVGASMGGFIAQTVALRDPKRVTTLTLIMTSTGSRRVGRPTPKLTASVLRRKPISDRQEAIEAGVATFRAIGSPGFPFNEPYVRELVGLSFDRGHNPAGMKRQLAAVLAQADRTKDLSRITAPTLVMHGLSDPLVSATGGFAVARAIPGARFVGFNGMGHGFPQELWPQFVSEIVANTRRADD
jgi:pimeloyl-ACP methyl ester carboxylesterase